MSRSDYRLGCACVMIDGNSVGQLTETANLSMRSMTSFEDCTRLIRSVAETDHISSSMKLLFMGENWFGRIMGILADNPELEF